MRRIWLHIGAPKSGTTSLQRALNTQGEVLERAGLSYISPRRLTSSNALAVALINDRKDDIANLTDNLARKARRASGDLILSSEQFFGLSPALLTPCIPEFEDAQVHVLCYLRRQDIYIESKYVQKRKRGAYAGSIFDFIQTFQGSGSDYETALTPWETLGATVHVRIAEPPRLTGGSVVTDALAVMGVAEEVQQDSTDATANSSPSLKRLQLLDAAKAAGFRDIRGLQRRLPPDTGQKARFFTPDERRAFVAGYAEMNERIRKRYAPEQDTLFSDHGLDEDISTQARFTDDELDQIRVMMREMIELGL